LFDCLRGGVVRSSRAGIRAQFTRAVCKKRSKLLQPSDHDAAWNSRLAPHEAAQSSSPALSARSDQSCCSPATTAQPCVATQQHNQASHVVAGLSFDQNMPRAPHVAPVLGPQRVFLGTPDHLRAKWHNTGALIQGRAKSRSERPGLTHSAFLFVSRCPLAFPPSTLLPAAAPGRR
jgi:hypothetical protein